MHNSQFSMVLIGEFAQVFVFSNCWILCPQCGNCVFDVCIVCRPYCSTKKCTINCSHGYWSVCKDPHISQCHGYYKLRTTSSLCFNLTISRLFGMCWKSHGGCGHLQTIKKRWSFVCARVTYLWRGELLFVGLLTMLEMKLQDMSMIPFAVAQRRQKFEWRVASNFAIQLFSVVTRRLPMEPETNEMQL